MERKNGEKKWREKIEKKTGKNVKIRQLKARLSSPPCLPRKDWCLQIGGSSKPVNRKMEFLIPHSIAPDRWGGGGGSRGTE